MLLFRVRQAVQIHAGLHSNPAGKEECSPMESVILQQPLVIALVLYGVALFLVIYDRHYRATKGAFTLVSTLLAGAATVYSLLRGASLWECAIILLVFLLLTMEVKE